MQIRPLAFALVVFLAPVSAAATPQAAVPQESPGEPRSLHGRVTVADTGAAVRRARVTARTGETLVSTATDDDGRFVFAGLAPARYRVSASKAPFVPATYGQRRPEGPGQEIDLIATPDPRPIVLRLARGGVIAGRITDDVGDAAAYVRVSAMRANVSEGLRGLVPTGRIATTDDLGQYRLAGLPPGRYYVGTVSAPADEAFNVAPSYYPGTQSLSDATVVAVDDGERQGVDFQLGTGGLSRLRGSIVDGFGRAVPHARVGLVSPASGSLSAPIDTRPDGTFSISNVAPGEYGVFAMRRNPDTGEDDLCMMQIDVHGDTDGISVTLDGGETIPGVVMTDDGSAPDFPPSALRIQAMPVPGELSVRMPSKQSGLVRPDWSFDLSGVLGHLRLSTAGLPAGWRLAQVLVGGVDVTDDGIRTGTGLPEESVRVVLTRRTTTIEGSVVDESGQVVLEYGVMVFPLDRAHWSLPSRYRATAVPRQDGRFVIEGLPPGQYFVVALDSTDEWSQEDPDALEQLRPHATSVRIEENARAALVLRLASPRR